MRSGVTAAAMVAVLAGNAYADELSFDFALSNGTQSASADFTFSAADATSQVTLRIELTNTMESNAGPNWLTGLFFNLAGSPTLTYQSLTAPSGMITLEGNQQDDYFDDDDQPGDPADFWAYRDDLSGELPFGDQQYGLGAAGLDIFGLQDIFNFPEIPGDILPQPAGSDGGILTSLLGDDGLSVPEGHEGRPFVLGSLLFEFLLPEGFLLSQAGVSDDVAFIFGTGFEEEILIIPLPLPIAMAGAGLMIVVCFRRRLVALAAK